MAHKLTDEQIEDLLVERHEKEAKRIKAKIRNLGWVQTDYAIGSKTSKGYFESEIDPETLEVTHILERD